MADFACPDRAPPPFRRHDDARLSPSPARLARKLHTGQFLAPRALKFLIGVHTKGARPNLALTATVDSGQEGSIAGLEGSSA
jgi:hypothetical protein